MSFAEGQGGGLLGEGRKHRATKRRRQIPGVGPIRAGSEWRSFRPPIGFAPSDHGGPTAAWRSRRAAARSLPGGSTATLPEGGGASGSEPESPTRSLVTSWLVSPSTLPRSFTNFMAKHLIAAELRFQAPLSHDGIHPPEPGGFHANFAMYTACLAHSDRMRMVVACSLTVRLASRPSSRAFLKATGTKQLNFPTTVV
jgi:hypothetical protein